MVSNLLKRLNDACIKSHCVGILVHDHIFGPNALKCDNLDYLLGSSPIKILLKIFSKFKGILVGRKLRPLVLKWNGLFIKMKSYNLSYGNVV